MKNTKNTASPTRREAENILKEAETCNPGAWGDHSRNVAMRDVKKIRFLSQRKAG